MKTATMQVIIGALGLVKKGMENYISEAPGNISVQETQKCVILSTAYIPKTILLLHSSENLNFKEWTRLHQ